MAATTTDESKISIKVTLDKQKKKVVFAEADHTFVDVLFSFMTLPMGSIVRQLTKETDHKKYIDSLKSLNNLYQSLVDLPESFFMNEGCKFTVLNPRSPCYDLCRKLKVNIDDTEPKKYYFCSLCTKEKSYISDHCKASCCKCGNKMNREVLFKDDDDCDGGGVFVSDASTFIVTDDLRVIPYTLECCIQMLIDHGVTDTTYIEEITVDLGYQQVLDLLGLSFSCNSPLTYLVLYPSRDLFIFQNGTLDLCTSAEKEDSEMVLTFYLQKSTGKFLFAEAEEDFVDFLSGFLAISLGTVIGKFMNGNSSLNCMDNIYKSILDMSVEKYFKSQTLKDMLLKPHFGRQFYTTRNLIFPLQSSNFPKLFLNKSYTYEGNIAYSKWYLSYLPQPLSATINDSRLGGEFMKRTGMFILTDDLIITPFSSTSTMNILSKCDVPLNDIEKHKVSVGLKEGIRMLKASMISSSSTLSKGLEHQLKIVKQST